MLSAILFYTPEKATTDDGGVKTQNKWWLFLPPRTPMGGAHRHTAGKADGMTILRSLSGVFKRVNVKKLLCQSLYNRLK
jgi:hypothetical protein